MEETNRFGSFAPQRSGDKVTLYVDGEETFRSIYEELIRAKQEILIASFFLSPEITLVKEGSKRKWKYDKNYSLSHILKEKAINGVKVWIFCWDETNVSNKYNSKRVKRVFKSFRNVTLRFCRIFHTSQTSFYTLKRFSLFVIHSSRVSNGHITRR